MLPVIVFAAVAVPLLVVGFLAMRRSRAAGEPPAESEADRRRTEKEFEESERYQEQWREEHRHDLDQRL